MEKEVVRVRIPRNNEVIGISMNRLGGNKLKVRCQDDKIRICRIPGRIKTRLWLRENNVVLIKPWKVQSDERGDILLKYTKAEVKWLKRKGILKMSL